MAQKIGEIFQFSANPRLHTRTPVPVESESEGVGVDVTLDEFNLDDFDAWDAPPPPPEEPEA